MLGVTCLNGHSYNLPPGHVMGSLLTTWWQTGKEAVGHHQHTCSSSCSLWCACPLVQGCAPASSQAPKPRCSRWPWTPAGLGEPGCSSSAAMDLCSSSVSSYIPNWLQNLPGTGVQFSQSPVHTPSSSPPPNAVQGSSENTVLLGERFLEPALFFSSSKYMVKYSFNSLTKTCAQDSYGL